MSAEMIDFMVDEHNIDIEPDLQRRVKVGYIFGNFICESTKEFLT